jgi:hypothetical protein
MAPTPYHRVKSKRSTQDADVGDRCRMAAIRLEALAKSASPEAGRRKQCPVN